MSITTTQRPAFEQTEHASGPATFAPAGANRKNNFNLLRLGLAVLVLLSHSPELIDGDRRREILTRLFGTVSSGEVAVDGFFLLSGFLILQSWLRKPALGDFLKKRVLRIYPAFLVASMVSVLVVGPLGSNPSQYFAQFDVTRFVWSSLTLHVPASPPVFEGQPYPVVNAAMWTIAYEFRCYLLVALIGVCGLAGRRWVWPVLAAAGLVLSVGFDLLELDHHIPRLLHLLTGELDRIARFVAFFCMGASFFSYRDRIQYRTKWALGAAVVLVACLFRPDTAQVGLLVLGGYFLFWFVFADTPVLERFRTYPDVSYGVYLYGWPTQKLLIWYIPAISPWLLFPLSILICGAAGWVSWTFVEHPFLRLKRLAGETARRPQPAPAAQPIPDSV